MTAASTREQPLVRLHALATALATSRGGTDKVARAIVEAAANALPIPGIALYVRCDDGHELLARHGSITEKDRPSATRPNLVSLPLEIEGERIGELILDVGQSRLDDDDRAFAGVIAHYAALAFHGGELVARERRFQERLRTLAKAGEMLNQSLDYETTLDNVLRLITPDLADFCFLDIVERGGRVRRVPNAHGNARVLAAIAGSRWNPSAVATASCIDICALLSGRVCVHSRIDEAWIDRVKPQSDCIDFIRGMSITSSVSTPLVFAGDCLGAITVFYSSSGRHHGEEQVELIEELARRAAVAVNNARLFEMSREATKRAEDAARQAEEAGRLKDDFLATVSHELRTPLSSILGWATLLRSDRGAQEPAFLGKGLEVIERNARAQQRIIEDILDVSRIITGKLRIDTEPVDLPTLARDVLESVRPTAFAKNIDLAFDCEGPCRLAGDSIRLRQILWNLLANAVKFTPEGGRVRLSIVQSGDRVVVRVRDTGRGIDSSFLPHVFERFRQADGSTTREHGGLGLGLAIVRHLTEMHGGSVVATSDGPQTGALFTVALPVRPFSAPVDRSTLAIEGDTNPLTPREPQPLAGLSVLVVEDEPDSRELIEVLLEGEGAVVRTASSADEALAALNDFDANVVLSDIGMPGRDGLWLARELRSAYPSMPTVALTAYSTSEDVSRALSAGFDQHVAKPVDPVQLVRALCACRRRSGAPGPQTRTGSHNAA